MYQLYREEGVNLKDWVTATEKWHSALVKDTNESFVLLRKVAVKLGLYEFLMAESDGMSVDLENATKEELEALRAEAVAAAPEPRPDPDPSPEPEPKAEGPDVKSVIQAAQIAMAASSAL